MVCINIDCVCVTVCIGEGMDSHSCTPSDSHCQRTEWDWKGNFLIRLYTSLLTFLLGISCVFAVLCNWAHIFKEVIPMYVSALGLNTHFSSCLMELGWVVGGCGLRVSGKFLPPGQEVWNL